MKFINLTRRTEIGANCYYLESGEQRIVLDCGMHPKEQGEDALPNFRSIANGKIDAILISHSHLDHIGSLPVLMRRQPQAHVFMTEASAQIGNALLHNSVNVMMRQREEIGTMLKSPVGTIKWRVSEARRVLQERYHVPVNWFCYPSGHYDATVITVRLHQTSEYRRATIGRFRVALSAGEYQRPH